MKKSMHKKLISAAACIMLCIGLTAVSGCGGGEKQGTESADTDTTEKERYVYNEFELNLGNDQVEESYLKGSNLYYISLLYPEYDETEEDADDEAEAEVSEIRRLHQYNTDSGEDTVLYEVSDRKALTVEGFCVTEENQVKIVYGGWLEDGTPNYTLVTKTMDGTELASVSFSDKMNTAFGEECRIGHVRFRQDGGMYIVCKQEDGNKTHIVRCDLEGTVSGSVTVDSYVDGIFFDNENKCAFEANSAEGLTYTYIDFEKGECGETVVINDAEGEYKFSSGVHGSGESSRLYDGRGDVTCYVRDTAGLCSYNASTQSVALLFGWTDSGIVGGFVDNVLPMEDGRLFCRCWNRGFDIKFGIVDALKEGKERKVIKCAALNTEDDSRHNLEQNIINYNKSNADYRVELVSYDKSSNPIDAFAKDVIAGKIPDVLDISGVDVKGYISRGFFEDLAPYMEKDGEFTKDYYVDGLYDAIAVDGKQYYAVKNFRLDTIVAKASDTEQYKDGWTIYDMIEYYNSKPEGTMLHITDARSELFTILVKPFLDDYIDWDTGKVSFDSDEFRALVEFLGKFPSDYDIPSDYNEVHKQIHEGKILINNMSVSSEPEELSMNKALYDNDIRFIGYPSADKKKACIVPSSSSLAIASSSKEKDGAWDFIKSVITDESYKDSSEFRGEIPSGKKQFEKMARRLTAAEQYTEEDGTVVKPRRGEADINGFKFKSGSCSEEDINVIRELIKNAVIKTDNSAIVLIVESGLGDYFDGRKTLDELISVLQDRVGKYVNENK